MVRADALDLGGGGGQIRRTNSNKQYIMVRADALDLGGGGRRGEEEEQQQQEFNQRSAEARPTASTDL